MKKILVIATIIILSCAYSQSLFEVKDASDNTVFSVSDDGLRVFNLGDTLMIISASEIRANLDNSKDRGLSRSFSISTNTTGKAGLANVLEVTTDATTMREGVFGDRYTDFSPENIFIGLNAGRITEPDGTYGEDNLFIGNDAGYNHTIGNDNIFIGQGSGYITNYGSKNVFMGHNAGFNNKTGGDNIYIGTEAGKGYQSGSIYSNGHANIAMGVNSGYQIKGAMDNVFLGYWTGYNTTDGDKNIFLGNLTGYTNTIESNNVYIGYASAAFNAGEKNVMVGSGDDDALPPGNTAMNGSVFLGFGAGTTETASNRLHIENSATGTPLIYGEFDNDIVKINGLFSVKTLEIADMGSNNLGLDGDVVPYGTSSMGFDIGNNVDGQYWDDIVGDDFINYAVVKEAKNIKNIESSVDKIMNLRPVTFHKDRKRFGLIPDEVEKIIPEVVVSQDIDIDPETGEKVITETEKGMNYIELIPVLIKSMQEQQEKIENLESKIESMQKLLNE